MTILDYQGRPVRLTAERLDHIHEHPEMTGLEPLIVKTITAPEIVVRSLSDPTATLSYHFCRGSPVGDKWLCVVIKHTKLDAYVLTAYLTDRIKKGILIWPNP